MALEPTIILNHTYFSTASLNNGNTKRTNQMVIFAVYKYFSSVYLNFYLSKMRKILLKNITFLYRPN